MISLLTPTRGRPSNMQRFVESAYETATLVTPEVIFYVDEDDLDSIGKAAQDTTYTERIARHTAQNTNQVYAGNTASRERDIAILKALMEAGQ